MDLKRLRTFVTVADLGTVSKAALRLRISQSALSRQIADLEQECGFQLFDRIGRRLSLTQRGVQVLADCRGVLGQVGSLGERIALLRRGDSGVVKLAAPPQTIESVLLDFLPGFTARFPNVQVKVTEALGLEQVGLIERGEVHLGIRHDQGANPWFGSIALPSDDVLAACRRSRALGRAGEVDIATVAAEPLLLLDAGYSVRRLFDAAAASAGSSPTFFSRAARHIPCWLLRRQGSALRSFPRCCAPIRYRLSIARVVQQRKPLRDRYVIQWDKRRPLRGYAESFCNRLAAYMRERLPITGPSVRALQAKRGPKSKMDSG